MSTRICEFFHFYTRWNYMFFFFSLVYLFFFFFFWFSLDKLWKIVTYPLNPHNIKFSIRGNVAYNPGPRTFLYVIISSCLITEPCSSQFLVHKNEMSCLMTKPTKWLCAQRRFRSALAFAQSDQLRSAWASAQSVKSDQPGHPPSLISLRCPHEESLAS